MAGPTKQRVFIHYVLGKMLLLFFLCHPGTLATCDGQAYLRNRYANRDLVKTEAELEDHRRHYKPRDASEFTMRIGVPDEILHGDVTGYAPDWTPTLEQRFRDTVMSWLRKGRTPAEQQQQPVAAAAATATIASPASARAAARGVGLVPSPLPARRTTPAATAATRAASGRTAFVSSPHALGSEGHRRYAREIARQRWMSITEVGRDPRDRAVNNDSTATRRRRVSALARRCSVGGCPGYGGSGDRRSTYLGCGGGGGANGPQMLLGRFRNRGVPLRRGIFGGGSAEADVAKDKSGGSSSSNSNNNNNNNNNINYVQAQTENDQMAVASPMALDAFEQDPEIVAAAGGSGAKSSVISSLLGGAADAYDSALSFVGCALVTSPLGKRYLSGASDGYNTVSTIRRTGGGPADVSSGSAYDLVGFSNIDPFEASGRGGGRSNRLLG